VAAYGNGAAKDDSFKIDPPRLVCRIDILSRARDFLTVAKISGLVAFGEFYD
jgi:hypothetical protein